MEYSHIGTIRLVDDVALKRILLVCGCKNINFTYTGLHACILTPKHTHKHASKAYKKLRWKATDYSMESEMIAKIGKYGLSYAEIPIETIYPDKYKGTTIIDGMKIVLNLLSWKFNDI